MGNYDRYIYLEVFRKFSPLINVLFFVAIGELLNKTLEWVFLDNFFYGDVHVPGYLLYFLLAPVYIVIAYLLLPLLTRLYRKRAVYYWLVSIGVLAVLMAATMTFYKSDEIFYGVLLSFVVVLSYFGVFFSFLWLILKKQEKYKDD